MKQKSLLKTLLLLCALVVGSVSAWAEDPTWSHVFASPEAISNNSITVDGATWSVTTTVGKGSPTISTGSYSQTYGLKFGSSKNAYFSSVSFSTDYFNSYNVKSVTVNILNNGAKTGTLTAQQGSTTIGSASAEFGTTWTDLTVNTTPGSGGSLSFTYSVDQAFYIHSITVVYATGNEAETVATPTFNPEAGTYTTAQSVNINCATEGAAIYYTTNGDDPTDASTLYTGAISVTTATTLKAIAVKSGMNNSTVATAAYTIKPNAPTITAEGSEVTITGDEGCTIYYTIDESAPSDASTLYTGPIDLEHSSLVRAIAYDEYGNASDINGKQVNFAFPLVPKDINSGYYEKVTDASTLEEGDAILIVNEGAEVAMSTTQNTNNRGSVDVTFAEENVIYVPSESVQKLLLVKRTDNNVSYFYFSTGEGYLYAASKNKNYLKTTDAPDDNARATITIVDGNATIQFTGGNSNNLLRYNGTNNPPIFSCYNSESSVQTPVQIYREVAHKVTATVTAAEYATFNSKYAVDFSESGITVYTATDGATSVHLNEITSGQVPANTPVVLHKAGGASAQVPVIPSADAVGDNDLRISTGTDVDNMYVLAMNPTIGFYPWTGTNLSAGKVYLQGQASYDTRMFIGFGGEATSIVDVDHETITNNRYFDLQGRRVAQPTKGLYIVNGKKVVVK